jgi:protein Tex
MDNPIQVDLGRIAQDLQIRRVQVESVVQLLDEGNTVPFITRYRKERTGNLSEVAIHEIQLRVQRLRDLAERKETILKAIEAQGKLQPDLAAAIRAADNPKRLEDLYLPFKPKKRTKASDARDKGLEPLALRIWNRDETLTDLTAAAQEFVSAEKGIETSEKVLEGVRHILAEAISEMATVREAVRKVVWKTGKIVTGKAEIPEGQGLEYRDYFDYSEPLSQVPPHRVLAINRGDKEGSLKVRLEVSRPELEGASFSQLPLEKHPQGEFFQAAAIDALDRLILPSMEREVRRDLTDAAEKHAVEVFARNLRSLLLQPPIPKQVVLAIDPGLRSGCKIAVLDPHGNLLDHGVVYPHVPQNRRSEAKVIIKDLVGKHKVGVVAIGNGTACRETEELIAEIIAEGIQFSQGESAPVFAAAPAAVEADAETPHPAAPPEPAGESVTEIEQAVSAHKTNPTAAGSLPNEPLPGDASPEQVEPVPVAAPDARETSSAASADTDDSSHAHIVSGESTATMPEEWLPPISGGAPESASPETETAITPSSEPAPESDSEPSSENSSNHSTIDGEGEGPSTVEMEAETPAVLPTVSEPVANLSESSTLPLSEGSLPAPQESPPFETTAGSGTESAQAAPQPSESGDDKGVGQTVPTPEPVDCQAASETVPTAPPAPLEGGIPTSVPAPTEETTTAHEPRRGAGKHDQGRSRGPRPRQAVSPTPPAPHPADALLAQLAYVIVNEAGASVYSTSQVGREELPEFDATLRSAISIGRRLQDPLAELVKIEPQNIGVGLYQHDVNPKQLKETLESVISSCVNFVGVDLNSASFPLVRHVSGLNQLTARRIVDYRKEKGAFTSREQLSQVEGIGPATYTQAAGFLKIPESLNPLDRTWVHPESYDIATKLLAKFDHAPEVVRDKERLPELRVRLAEAKIPELAKELEVGEYTLQDIIEALCRPERDPRDDLPKPIFKKGILQLEDLTPGMELKGTVLNVVDFGAFVDIGLKDSGLVHISQLANRYIKSPHDVVSVGDVVTVWVMGVDQERKRVSLTMVKPGTERQRGGGQGGQRRGGGGSEREQREGQGSGQGRRGGGRPPRPSGSALTSPPVGAPPIAALAEAPAKRPERDRDRGGAPGSQGQPRGSQGEMHGSPGGGGGHTPSAPRHGQGQEPGRGSPRGGFQGQGTGGGRPGHGGRPERPQAPRGPARPSRPSPPPPPLSKEALSGSVPLRTFGQLKQLWEARVEPPSDQPQPAEPAPQPGTETPTSAPAPPLPSRQPEQTASTPPPEAEPAPEDSDSKNP